MAHDDSRTIGPYRTLRELGRGGQAIVWLAEDTRIQRQVALKVLPNLGPGGEEALRRFRREAEVASHLDHPGICGVLEAELDHGAPYIAMRYVAGETLAKHLASDRAANAPPPDRARLRELAHLFEKAARALHAAHEAGVIHRDVKPANIMVTPEGEPVILDFGLARQDDGTAHALSVTGEASGTPAYMSPEQMTGRARPDRRADVWSLGIALYECATLRHPFEAATREGLFQSILTEDPPDPRRESPAIDRDFATILETATEKERDRRYQSALDLAEDLRRWRENEPIRARPAGRFERIRRWAQRNPALAGSAAAIVLLLVAAIALLSYGVGASGNAHLQSQLRTEAEKARELAETERTRADEARLALEGIQADRRLAAELDELTMKHGTLIYGFQSETSAASLLPEFMATFADAKIDLSNPDGAQASVSRLTALRERNPELWSGVRESFDALEWLVAHQDPPAPEALRAQTLALLHAFPAPLWVDLEDAVASWEGDGVDEFAPLLTDEALEGKSADQLWDLATKLLSVPDRVDDAEGVLDRALQADPGSFRLHYLRGSIGFFSAMQAQGDPQKFKACVAKIVHHLEVSVALRPHSGFVRAALAGALAMGGAFEESQRCIESATELEPDNALVWLMKARWYGFSPSPQLGVDACKKALELDPELGGARDLLAELEAKVKK